MAADHRRGSRVVLSGGNWNRLVYQDACDPWPQDGLAHIMALVVLVVALCGVGLSRIRKRARRAKRWDSFSKIGSLVVTLSALNACSSSPLRGDAAACTWPAPLDAAGACSVLGVTSECASNQYEIVCGGLPHVTDAGYLDSNYYQQAPDECIPRRQTPGGWSSWCCPCH